MIPKMENGVKDRVLPDMSLSKLYRKIPRMPYGHPETQNPHSPYGKTFMANHGKNSMNHPGNTERARLVKLAMQCYYHIDGNGAGGTMHIVFDDQNIDDHSIDWVKGYTLDSHDRLGTELADAMANLTWEERCYVVDIEDPVAFKQELNRPSGTFVLGQ